jgi:hypothetical protein
MAERRLIDAGQPYLRLVWHAAHWRVYAVADPTPIVQGAATLRAIGPNWLALRADGPGTALVRIHFSPYWALTEGSGCVEPAGDFTKLALDGEGPVRLAIRFSLGWVGTRSRRCRR